MRTVARVLALSTSAVLGVGLMPGVAHAAVPVLSATVPTAGSSISADPATISATFSGSTLAAGSLSVTGPSTISCVASGTGTSTLSCTPSKVPPGAWADGTYTVSYSATATSALPNQTTGSFSFTLDKTAPGVAVGVAASPSPYA
jgi:methionine-rich copper-binding protein CopC